MQLNFLQEDLLAAMQKNKPIVPIIALQNNPKTFSKPVQTSLLADEPEVVVAKQKKAAAPRAQAPVAQHAPAEKAPSAFKTISEAAEILGVPTHVLRFWETQFPQISPTKSRGGRRYYRPEDMEVLTTIKHLLYKQGYTIKGAKKAFSQMRVDVAAEAVPVAVEKPTKLQLSDKQKAQLASVRQELLGLKASLGAYLG